MKAIEKIYQPYDFSSTRCYVIPLLVTTGGYLKIERKLPAHIKKLKGIFISVSNRAGTSKVAGYIMLTFNGHALKIFQMPVQRTNILKDCSHPIPFDEEIKSNSFLQGFYFDITNEPALLPYSLSIYLHYE